MLHLSKTLMILASIGEAIWFSVAMTGVAHITCSLIGTQLSEHAAGNLFMISSLLTGSIAACWTVATLKEPLPTDSWKSRFDNNESPAEPSGLIHEGKIQSSREQNQQTPSSRQRLIGTIHESGSIRHPNRFAQLGSRDTRTSNLGS